MVEGNTNLARQLIDAVTKQRKRVAILGDAMTDKWIYVCVEDCQDHCKKLVTEKVICTPGGAANAENCLSQWNVKYTTHTYPTPYWPTKTRFLDADGKILYRWDDERTRWKVDRKWHDAALEMVNCADAVLLSDYDKGFLTPEFIAEVVSLCAKRGTPCIADCKRAPEVYAGCVLKGNEDWCFKHIANGVLSAQIVMTRGPRKPVLDAGDTITKEWSDVVLVNHVGAGDCFAAHLALALAYGFRLKDAAAIAHSAGRVYVQFPHNRPPLPSEIVRDMEKKTPAECSQRGHR